MITKILGSLVQPVAGYFNERLKKSAQIAQAKHELQLAELNNKARLMSDQQQYNAAWEMKALSETGRTLKHISFTLLCAPIVLTMLSPYIGYNITAMWDSLSLVPQWWQNTYVAANACIWGTLQIRDLGGMKGIVQAFKK